MQRSMQRAWSWRPLSSIVSRAASTSNLGVEKQIIFPSLKAMGKTMIRNVCLCSLKEPNCYWCVYKAVLYSPSTLAVSPLWETGTWGSSGCPSGPTVTASPLSNTSSSTLWASGTSSRGPIGTITWKSCGTASERVQNLSQLREAEPW